MQHLQKAIVNNSILEVQILSPIKYNGSACTWELNNAVQEIYNPSDKNKAEITVFYAKGKTGILRVGDQVMNTKNNYKA